MSEDRVGREDLMRLLREELGLSDRKATKAVTAFFKGVTRQLLRGETVEIGGCRLKVRQTKRKRLRDLRFRYGHLKGFEAKPRFFEWKAKYVSVQAYLAFDDAQGEDSMDVEAVDLDRGNRVRRDRY